MVKKGVTLESDALGVVDDVAGGQEYEWDCYYACNVLGSRTTG